MNRTYPFEGNILGDPIQMLPVDEIPPTVEECNILNRIFTPAMQNTNKFKDDIKFILVIIFVYIIISLPQTKGIMTKFIPITEKSIYIEILLKGIILAFIIYMYLNIHLVFKRK